MLLIIRDTDEIKDRLYPLAQTHESWNLRIGIFTVREKWEQLLGCEAQETENGLEFSSVSDALTLPGTILPNLMQSLHAQLSPNHSFETLLTVRDILTQQQAAFLSDFSWIAAKRTSTALSTTNQILGQHPIFIEEGAIVECTILNASDGPIYIGKDAEVMEGSCIRGPFSLGKQGIVKMGAKIYSNTFVGESAVVGGELKNTTIQDFSNKGHDGYLGDAIIGQWCNLGAGTSASNVKNNAGEVRIWNKASNQFVSVGVKCGLVMGDYSKAAINTSFNTGTVVGVGCNVFSNGLTPKYIPDFSWGINNDVLYDVKKLTVDIESWKKFKNKTLTPKEIQDIERIFERNLNQL